MTLLTARVAAVAAERVTVARAAPEARIAARIATRVPTARDLRRVAVTAHGRGAPGGRPATAADAGLALLTKIGEHLVGDDVSGFLSFPAVALAADPPGSFGLAHAVSVVPRHATIWHPPIGSTLIWDVWRQILDEAVVVDPDPDAAERAEIDAARRLVFSDPEAGTLSPAYERYRALLEEYLDAAAAAVDAPPADDGTGTAEEGSAGPSAPAPPTVVEVAARRLAVEGRQAEIEAALSTIARYGLSRPTAAWNEARQAFELVTNWRTDPVSGTEYPDTTFVPSSFEQAAWTAIELDAAEIETLSALATERFPALAESKLFDDTIADEGGLLRVTGLRAEITRFAVRQSWFRPDLLGMRSWRFRNPDAEVVSDGGQPVTGRLPAFVTSVAVIRNLEIDRIRVIVRDHRRPVGTAPAAMPGGVAVSHVPSRGRPTSFAGAVVRDHRSAPSRLRRQDDADWFPDPRIEPTPVDPVPVEPVPVEPVPVTPHLEQAPRIAAFVCQLVPRSPDPEPPDPARPNPAMEATT